MKKSLANVKKNYIWRLISLSLLAALFFCAASCSKTVDMSLAEIEKLRNSSDLDLVAKTTSKPYENQEYKPGTIGGIWNDTILNEPKTFNQLVGMFDGESSALISKTLVGLCDYEPANGKWSGYCCTYKIDADEKNDKLTVHFTLRDDIYWSYWKSSEKIPLTSDDFVFWYNEIDGDEEAGLGGKEAQCLEMPDGTSAHINCVKIDDKNFDFIFPRIVAEPLLTINMSCCPSFLYKPAKEKGGIQGVKNLFGVDCDVTKIPSCGEFFITEYIPSRKIVFSRNPDFFKKDVNGTSRPYYEQLVCQIVGDQNTDYLLFNQGKTEAYSPRPEELQDVIANQKSDYTVYNSEGSMNSYLWTFNQNPCNKDKPFYKWFTKKEFRQAMSCILNRERIINQTYRGLADPRYFFFPPSNSFYNEKITLDYKYDVERASRLLKSAGFTLHNDGFLYDEEGTKVEFEISVLSGITVLNDISAVISDEAAKVGIKVNPRQIDFQKLVESITSSYDWESCFIAFGAMIFPTQGQNVWLSSGNMHLWNPNQKEPATEWEARVDKLYKTGTSTVEHEKAKKIWDEYQSILLEQCPVIYLIRSRSFFALRNKWDMSNVYFDNVRGADTDWVFMAKPE